MSLIYAIIILRAEIKKNFRVTDKDHMCWALFSIADALWLLLIWKVVMG